MRFHIPIHLPSLANSRLHWRRLAKIKRQQRQSTALCLRSALAAGAMDLPPLPLVITITRVGPRRLDDDNLAAACKYVRDQIAAAVGEDDGSPLYTWRYEQAISMRGVYGVYVEITPRGDGL